MLRMIGGTDKGRVRAVNQDTYTGRVVSEELAYGVVCDGMGGENGGETASSLACAEMERILEGGIRPGMDNRSVHGLLESALVTANAVVHQKAADVPSLVGMGTTAVAAVVLGSEIVLCHAGDSRAYLVTAQEPKRLTVDHTVVQMLINKGEITEEEAATHPGRHYITRAVGADERISADFGSCTLEQDQVLLLCSDGLYNMIDGAEFLALAKAALEQNSAAPFLERANQLGGADNITVLLIYNC